MFPFRNKGKGDNWMVLMDVMSYLPPIHEYKKPYVKEDTPLGKLYFPNRSELDTHGEDIRLKEPPKSPLKRYNFKFNL